MPIAIDFDGTWTLDSKSWGIFYNMFTAAGHNIAMVTGPGGLAQNDLPRTVYTTGQMKEKAAER